MISNSILSWTVAAGLLFWAVGAYNRLMRLRAEAHTAFAAVEAEFTKHVEPVYTICMLHKEQVMKTAEH